MWDEAEHTLTKASSSLWRALSHSCRGHVPALLGLWGEGRAGLEGGAAWGHLCMLRRTAGMRLPAAAAGGWISCSGEGCASPSAKNNCGWDSLLHRHSTAERAASQQHEGSPFPVPHALGASPAACMHKSTLGLT